MTVGIQANPTSFDQTLTSLAIEARTLMRKLRDLNTQVNGPQSGSAYLQGIGYSGADAPIALQYVNYMSNIQGVYYGTAIVAAQFSFDNGLSPLWAGQIT